MNVRTDSGEDALVRATVRSIASACRQRTSTDPQHDHSTCWSALRDGGFADLRSETPALPPLLFSLIVVEEMARSLCGAPVVSGALLSPELLRLGADAGHPLRHPAEEPLGLVLAPNLDQLGSGLDQAVAWDTRLTSAALAVHEGSIGVVDLGPEIETADLTRQVRRTGAVRQAGTRGMSPEEEARFLATARLAVAADSLGAASQVFEDSVEFAKARVQYGQAIGAFQAVQHILGAAYVRLEAVRSSLMYSSWLLDFGGLAEASESALVTKAYVAGSAVEVVHAAIQVFGGIAITWEHHAHRHLRRVVLNRQLFGEDRALERQLAGAKG